MQVVQEVFWHSEFPNLETFLAKLRWRAYFPVSGRRSNCRVPLCSNPERWWELCIILALHVAWFRCVKDLFGRP